MLKKLLAPLVDFVIKRAQTTPYFPLNHEDGRLYMGRWWLLPKWMLEITDDDEGSRCLRPKKWLPFGLRIHHIATADYDRHLHDHPFTFISLLLRGWYVEQRPIQIDPCFETDGDTETCNTTYRKTGSIALRRAVARHAINKVSPGGCWTLVLTFNKVQWWGFYTPAGKVHWQEYFRIKGPS